MHDPKTVAFEIRNPFASYEMTGKKHRPSLVTIWHSDPEVDGSDDSCGYSYARLTRVERDKCVKIAREIAAGEYEGVFNCVSGAYHPQRPYAETIFGLFDVIAWRVFRMDIKPRHLPRIFRAVFNPTDNLQSLLRSPLTMDDVERLFCVIARNIKTYDRRWWQMPKFHVHHWRFQIHPLESLRRMFTRCASCSRHFGYGESGVNAGDGLCHFDCYSVLGCIES